LEVIVNVAVFSPTLVGTKEIVTLAVCPEAISEGIAETINSVLFKMMLEMLTAWVPVFWIEIVFTELAFKRTVEKSKVDPPLNCIVPSATTKVPELVRNSPFPKKGIKDESGNGLEQFTTKHNMHIQILFISFLSF
jgi:hypothetical protein